MTEHKTRYTDFCQTNYVPLQLQPWWLDAVCAEGAWDVCIAMDGGGAVTGILPWHQTRRLGLPIIQQPPLTTYGGPWLRYPHNPDFKSQSRFSFEKKIFGELIERLPRTAFFQQNFLPEIENWLPFHWAGFRQTTRYTYIFNDLSDLGKTWAGFENTLRTDLKKAGQAAETRREDAAAELMFQLHAMSFQRKNRRPPYSFETFWRLHSALQERQQSACFIARDRRSNAPHTGLYLAFDERRASVLLTGTDPIFKASCAVWALFWAAVQFCSERNLSLDFEGSMEPDIERGFRAFGARLVPYHQIWRAGNKLLDLIYALQK